MTRAMSCDTLPLCVGVGVGGAPVCVGVCADVKLSFRNLPRLKLAS